MRKLMDDGSLTNLLQVAHYDVTVRLQLEGYDVGAEVKLHVCFILYMCTLCVCWALLGL